MPTKKKRRNTADLLDAALDAGSAIQEQDRNVDQAALNFKIKRYQLPLSKIQERDENTRELNPSHVADLSESIAALGLLEPLVVDVKGKLLAGGHRKASIELIKAENQDRFLELFPDELIPVHVYEIDAQKSPEIALEIEVSENEKRKDYTPTEVKNLAERLLKAGYVEVKGRPSKGQKPLRPALELIIGKNIRTVRRYLNASETESVTNVRLSEDEKLKSDIRALKRLKSELLRWEKCDYDESYIGQMIRKDVSRLIQKADKTLIKIAKDLKD